MRELIRRYIIEPRELRLNRKLVDAVITWSRAQLLPPAPNRHYALKSGTSGYPNRSNPCFIESIPYHGGVGLRVKREETAPAFAIVVIRETDGAYFQTVWL